MERKQIRNTILASITIGAFALSALPASATQSVEAVKDPTERHCVVTVIDDTDGVLSTGPETCFDTREEVEAFINGGGRNESSARSGTNTIGIHFTNTSFSGSSVTVIGTTCAGGVWKPTGSWNNNIESSYNLCGGSGTRFYNYSSCTSGAYLITLNSATLGSMNNKASCVRYG